MIGMCLPLSNSNEENAAPAPVTFNLMGIRLFSM
jgi:hypothetical protein